ncbi:MAG: hypothetical protein JWP27_3072 [Flaviaesturariibacter sp.]|nr:hypothetical protein [Flaviaesturariibacter sp.]
MIGPYCVLVTGSRDWPDNGTVEAALTRVLRDVIQAEPRRDFVVVHGDCPTGADRFAVRWAEGNAALGVHAEAHPADWRKNGKAAGPLRNSLMVNLGADLCLAFPLGASRGTRDCMRKAAAAGIPVRVVSRAPEVDVPPCPTCRRPVEGVSQEPERLPRADDSTRVPPARAWVLEPCGHRTTTYTLVARDNGAVEVRF